MDRSKNLKRVRERTEPWDIVVIGGGATGAGCALDAASRGFSVLLLEQHDFGKSTSSRSTKLIHGGVRYLKQGNISLVRESLKERGILLRNAPHVVHRQAFIIPCYAFWEKAFYGVGMKVYDRLSGKYGIGDSRILSRGETLEHLPSIKTEGLSGGVLYYDGQFDDARLLIDLLRSADQYGAAVLNYAKVTELTKGPDGTIGGAEFIEAETGESYTVKARTVINAAGIFADPVRQMSDGQAVPLLTFSQGIHIVLDRKFMPSNDALMIPKTSDSRVLFCIPWQEHLLIGTTDTPTDSASLEPEAIESEIDFVLETAGDHLETKPKRSDILSVFAGIRPLIATDKNRKTSSLSRGHDLFVDEAGLVTITGGKWTTYRRMAEDAVDKAIEVGGLQKAFCRTETLSIKPPEADGSSELLHPGFPYTRGDVVRSVRDELARTVEDVLARRTRILFLNVKTAITIAPTVADLMSAELVKDEAWKADQLRAFAEVAGGYQIIEPANDTNEHE